VNKSKSQGGQALILIALALPVLFGAVGLAFDIGFLEMMKRQAQTAADAGAIAGAVDLPYGTMTTSARAATAVNGFTNGVKGATVTVNNPPANGPHAGSACAPAGQTCNYVEAIVSQPEPTFFLRMVGAGPTSTVAARAVAYNTAGDCVFALNPTMSGALTLGTGFLSLVDIDTPNCAIIVDSNSSSAIQVGALLAIIAVTARQTAVVGGVGSCFFCSLTFTPPAVTHIAPESDPLAYLQAPATVACSGTLKTITTTQTVTPGSGASCYNVNISGSPTVTFKPGTYSAITVAGGITGTPTLIFNPGLYILEGTGTSAQCFATSTCSLSISGVGATILGNGVTFYIGPSAGSVAVSGIVNTINLTPPSTTGLLPNSAGAGVLFYQDRTNSSQACIGGCGSAVSGIFNTVQVQGALYFPAAGITFDGCCQYTPGNLYYTAYEILVADHMTLSWDYFNDDYSSLPGGSPVKRTLLVE
jgi:Flp pilus assembly protein TadG